MKTKAIAHAQRLTGPGRCTRVAGTGARSHSYVRPHTTVEHVHKITFMCAHARKNMFMRTHRRKQSGSCGLRAPRTRAPSAIEFVLWTVAPKERRWVFFSRFPRFSRNSTPLSTFVHLLYVRAFFFVHLYIYCACMHSSLCVCTFTVRACVHLCTFVHLLFGWSFVFVHLYINCACVCSSLYICTISARTCVQLCRFVHLLHVHASLYISTITVCVCVHFRTFVLLLHMLAIFFVVM